MSNAGEPTKTVVVSGDVTIDWNLARSAGPGAPGTTSRSEVCARMMWQRGGAALLADLIEAIAVQIGAKSAFDIRQPKTPRGAGSEAGTSPSPEDHRFHHSYAAWSAFSYGLAKGLEKEKPAWRVAEFLGLDRCAHAGGSIEWAGVADDNAGAWMVVLDDADLGFRSTPELWPKSLTTPESHPWVVVKMSRPIAQGPLWQHLCAYHHERLIVVMTVNDLRLSEVQISRELSWERTAQDLAWEIAYNRDLRSLRSCAHVVVSFGSAGAFLYSRSGDPDGHCQLIFDPAETERTWEQGHPGRVVGYTSCITAGIARQLMLEPGAPDLRRGIRSGLAALRYLHREGYGARGASAMDVRLSFPAGGVVEALATDNPAFQETTVPMRRGSANWTILGERYQSNLEDVAREVVLNGPQRALTGVPLGRFGDLLTVDWQEIESLRSIRSLVSEYVSQPRPKRPLSIAVFGPPGAGKSFGITQLALALRPGEIQPKEFNLSQLGSPDDLLSALHQVRDIGLGGKIPLVFWDEFDSDLGGAYGWLRYFLAPMQDGQFQHGELSHPIGKAIFVFAGATSWTLDGFGTNVPAEQARAAKVPDFVSRLKGYINVLGPNPQEGRDDPHFILRRAILLRSMLERGTRQILKKGVAQIDSGVLRALLLTKTYRHGARSMESVIAMSQLAGASRFERSCLPTEAQLDLHVDGLDFLARVRPLGLDDETLYKLAREVHASYCAEQKALGWKYGPLRNEVTKENSSLVAFDDLPDDEKEQNRNQARDISAKLAYAGCYMLPARSGEPPFAFPPRLLDELASLEHTRWMFQKVRDGWRYAPETDKAARLHKCLLPWDPKDLSQYSGILDSLGTSELTDVEKDKDRSAVRTIGAILEAAGYTIVAPLKKAGREAAASGHPGTSCTCGCCCCQGRT